MDNQTKLQLEAQIVSLSAFASQLESLARLVQTQAPIPINTSGPIAVVPNFNTIAQALLAQSQATVKLIKVVENLIKKM